MRCGYGDEHSGLIKTEFLDQLNNFQLFSTVASCVTSSHVIVLSVHNCTLLITLMNTDCN